MNHMTRTFHRTHTTAQAYSFFNHRTVINYSDRACCTGLLTDSAANTADLTLFLCFRAFLLIGTFYYNVISAFVDMNNILRAYFCTGSAADTFIFIYLCYTIFIGGNGPEFALIYAGSAADTAICTACLTFSRSASPITCYNR